MSLDTPGRVSRQATAWIVAAASLNVIVVAVVAGHASRQLGEAPVVATVHATATFVVAGITAMLLFAHAHSTPRRAYLVLGATFAAVAALMVVVPFVFPGALGPPEPLIGGMQSSISIFYWWHIVLIVGITAGAALLDADRRSRRRRRREPGIWPVILSTAAAMAVVIFLSTRQVPPWPTMLDPEGDITDFVRLLDVVLVGAAAVCFAVTAYGARHRSYMGTWLAVVGPLVLGDAVVNQRNPARYTVGWYYNRGYGLLITSALLVALVSHLSRIDRANSRLAATDLLTGTGSRAELAAGLEREMTSARAAGEQVALLWVDLDGFKSVNDELGHAVGDRVLRVVAGRLRSAIRSTDMVARLGGDEFGILLCDDADERRAEAVAERVLAAVREPVDLDGTTTLLSASVGVAVAPDDADTPDELLHRADQAMYAAKKPGGDRRSRFVSGIGADASHRAELRRQLTRALRHRELDLDYQPVVDPVTGELLGAEALVRWMRDGRRIPAAKFIGLAEATGQIQAIGMLVVEMLEHDLPLIRAAMGEGTFVSFNLSSMELADLRITDRLLEGPLGSRTEDLVVEVTEGLDMQPGGEAERRLGTLRAAGIRVAIDDFGSGFSNFVRLAHLAPSLVKVDRSIVVRAAGGGMSDMAFLSAVVSVADALDCAVVAEGVETEAEAAMVTKLKIPMAQGYRWARPMPAHDLVELCHRGAPLGR